MITTDISQRQIVRTAKNVLLRVKREERRLKNFIFLHGGDVQEGTGRSNSGGKERFHTKDLIPILQGMHGEFTLDDVMAQAKKAGVTGERLQFFSAIYSLQNMIRVVRPGFGRNKAVYALKKKAK